MANLLDLIRKKKVREILYRSFSYENFDLTGFTFDLQGWNGNSPIFPELIDRVGKPGLIIEVGSWKGLSAVNMAKHIKKKNIDCELVCIDTWLGL